MAFESLLAWAKSTNKTLNRPRMRDTLFITLPVLLLLKILYFAWVTEDAYITFRVVDNFLHGFGLTWNITERVQVYTHPLWMLAHIPLVWLTGDVFYTTIFFSALISLAAFLLIAWPLRQHPLLLLSLVFLPLFFSSSFIDYSTSGLENPLSHLLLAAFGTLFFSFKGKTPPWFLLALFAALTVLNRMDLLLFFIFPMLYLLVYHYRNLRFIPCLLGTLPLLIWLTFSFIYYGSFFPNTKYAKLDVGVSLPELMAQGAIYFYYFILQDLPTSLLVLLGVLVTIYGCWLGVKRHNHSDLRFVTFGSGIVLYLVYLFSIGGDYMSGRLLTPVIVSSAVLVSRYALTVKNSQQTPIVSYVGFWMLLLSVIGNTSAFSIMGRTQGVTDLRFDSKETHTLLKNLSGLTRFHQHEWVEEGLYIRQAASCQQDPALHLIRSNAGVLPYFAGPHVHFIDPFGLTDPLLARLPLRPDLGWWAGHYFRSLPFGYLHLLETGSYKRMDPALAAYHQVIAFITRGEIWNLDRLYTALAFNLGTYDPLRKSYVKHTFNRRDFPLSHLSETVSDTPEKHMNARITSRPQNLLFGRGTTYTIHATRTLYPRYMDTFVQDLYDHQRKGRFIYRFYKGERHISSISLKSDFFSNYHLPKRRYLIALPKAIIERGFDRVYVSYTTSKTRKRLPAMVMHMVFRDCLTCEPITGE